MVPIVRNNVAYARSKAGSDLFSGYRLSIIINVDRTGRSETLREKDSGIKELLHAEVSGRKLCQRISICDEFL